MIYLAFTLIFSGGVVLSLSMKRHFKQCNPQRKMLSHKLFFCIRISGYSILALSLYFCLVSQGIGVGLVLWFGAATLIFFLQSLLLSYQPQWLMPIGLCTLIYALGYTSI